MKVGAMARGRVIVIPCAIHFTFKWDSAIRTLIPNPVSIVAIMITVTDAAHGQG